MVKTCSLHYYLMSDSSKHMTIAFRRVTTTEGKWDFRVLFCPLRQTDNTTTTSSLTQSWASIAQHSVVLQNVIFTLRSSWSWPSTVNPSAFGLSEHHPVCPLRMFFPECLSILWPSLFLYSANKCEHLFFLVLFSFNVPKYEQTMVRFDSLWVKISYGIWTRRERGFVPLPCSICLCQLQFVPRCI